MANDEEHDDWAGRATELVEHLTAVVRDHSVKPLTGAIRALAAAVIIGLVGIVAFVAVVIGLVRLVDNDVFAGRVWATDALIGGMFAAAGLFFLRQGMRTGNRHG